VPDKLAEIDKSSMMKGCADRKTCCRGRCASGWINDVIMKWFSCRGTNGHKV